MVHDQLSGPEVKAYEDEEMKRATLEILEPGEKIFGSHTGGRYWVQEFEDDQPKGGQFFTTIEEAEQHMLKYEGQSGPTLLVEENENK